MTLEDAFKAMRERRKVWFMRKLAPQSAGIDAIFMPEDKFRVKLTNGWVLRPDELHATADEAIDAEIAILEAARPKKPEVRDLSHDLWL